MNTIIKKISAFLLILCTISATCASAAPEKQNAPIANTYTEGIYRFESGVGNKLNFKLLTPDKPLVVMLLEEDDLKYYAQLNKNFKEVQIILTNPLKNHTAVLVGDGELSFTFE